MGSIDGKALSEIGRRSRASGDYWEQLLGLEDTARLMQIFFDGQEIKEWLALKND